jgi:hypothetical protein
VGLGNTVCQGRSLHGAAGERDVHTLWVSRGDSLQSGGHPTHRRIGDRLDIATMAADAYEVVED